MSRLGWMLAAIAAAVLVASTGWFRQADATWLDPVVLVTVLASRRGGAWGRALAGLAGGLVVGAAAFHGVEGAAIYASLGALAAPPAPAWHCLALSIGASLLMVLLSVGVAGLDRTWWPMLCNDGALVYVAARVLR